MFHVSLSSRRTCFFYSLIYLKNGRGKLVLGRTQIRYSWYFSLPYLYTHDHLIDPSFKWIINRKVSNEALKNNIAIVRNFAKVRYDKTITFPLAFKDHQIRIHKEIPFSPIYFVTTEQKKTSFEYEKNIINSVRFSIRLYPIGFGVISAYIDFNKIIKPNVNEHFVSKLKCGSKKTSMTKYVQYLKVQLLRSLFQEKELASIKSICKGPKIRINIIDKQFSEQEFAEYSNNVLGTKNSTTKIFLKYNKKTDDQIAFAKKGLVVFTDTILSKGRRQYFRNNLDFIMDLFYGAKVLIPLVPSLLTKVDSLNQHNRINDLISTVFFSLNPEILESNNELISLLPTAGLRVWLKSLNKIHNYSNEYISHTQEIMTRINEVRVDLWYELITTLLKESTPIVNKILMDYLKEQKISIRELITPKVKLDKESKLVIDFLLKKIVTDYVDRFGFSANTQLSKNKLGFCTLNIIEKALGITGRKHLEFKNRLETLSRVGLLETEAYTGPGARKDSVYYRASPKHPYIDSFLRVKLAQESISELKLK